MKIYLFSHDGSKNHGCEAIVRSTIKLLKGNDIHLISSRPEEDIEYNINEICALEEKKHPKKYKPDFILAYLKLKLFRNSKYVDEYYLTKAPMSVIDNAEIAMAIGGDAYCYGNEYRHIMRHKIAAKNAKNTIYWGCSIEPELLKNAEIADDISRYDLITARETISYDALKTVNPNTILVADPAFQLDKTELPLPSGFVEGNTVGINVSPLVSNIGNLVYENYSNLIKYIIQNTSMQIALIPHVVWKGNNDLEVLTNLYNEYKNTERVILIGDHNCEELKGFIARCRFFVGARTHATIAAYSTCVPTLVSGYSVKARGIARDIFGTEKNYVIPVQEMQSEDDLTNAFMWLIENENHIRKHLNSFIPEYCQRSLLAIEAINKLIEE